MSIGVLLAEGYALLRAGMNTLLQAQADMRVLGEAARGHEAVDAARRLHPDVVVMNASMPDITGVQATRWIRSARPETRVVILSLRNDPEDVYRALEAGANGYLLMESTGAELAAAIRTVHVGRRYLTPRVREQLIEVAVRGGRSVSPLASLSIREREILRLIVEGHSTVEAASLLGLSVKTVGTYRSRMVRKLGIDNLATLVKFAIAHGITHVN